jgi:hypothetical protein
MRLIARGEGLRPVLGFCFAVWEQIAMANILDPHADVDYVLDIEFQDGRMKCAACGQTATPEHRYGSVLRSVDRAARALGSVDNYPWFTVAVAICASCGADNVFIRKWQLRTPAGAGELTYWKRRVSPIGRAAKGFPNTPASLVKDYREACATVDVSPAASACMSRRCLQGILHEQGYRQRDLADQIQGLLGDATRRLPAELHETVDVIRQFGNFGAHRKNDKATLEIIEVEEGEADWCIEIAERLIEHFYELPARSKAKLDSMKAKLGGNMSAAKT